MNNLDRINPRPCCPSMPRIAWVADELAVALGRPIDPRLLVQEARWAMTLRLEPRLFDSWIAARPRRERVGDEVRRQIVCACDHEWLYCERHGSPTSDPDGNGWQVDHYIPIARGGSNHWINLMLACQSCNYEKGANLWSPGCRRGHTSAAPLPMASLFDLAAA